MAYTNRQRRNNILRSLCLKFVRQKMPKAYALFQAEAERIYRNQRPDLELEYLNPKHSEQKRDAA
jgi:hypothetical protein